MLRLFISLLFLTVACTNILNAQTKEEEVSENIQKALFYMDCHANELAVGYLKDELKENPRSLIALDLLGFIYYAHGNLKAAISCFNKVVRYNEETDYPLMATVYYHRAGVRAQLGDTLSSIADYKRVIKMDSTHRNAMIELSTLYFCTGQYEQADSVYQQMIRTDATDPYPYYAMAMNEATNGDYDKALLSAQKGEILDENKEQVNTMLMYMESRSNHPRKVLHYAVRTLQENNYNQDAYDEIVSLPDSLYPMVVDKLVQQQTEYAENDFWSMLLCDIYIRHYDYRRAADCLAPLLRRADKFKYAELDWIASFCERLNYNETVIKLMDYGISEDSTYASFYLKRADAEFYTQDLGKAEQDYRKTMELDKKYGSYCYYRIGWIKEMQKNYELALAHYDISIFLDPAYAYSYLMKGNLLKDYLNRPEEARQAFLKCIETDEGINDNTCKQYAYLALGETDKAIAVNDSILKVSPEPGSYYDAACLYSRMGKRKEAITYLRQAVENGFRNIRHIEKDDDMDNIRDMKEFKELLKSIRQP